MNLVQNYDTDSTIPSNQRQELFNFRYNNDPNFRGYIDASRRLQSEDKPLIDSSGDMLLLDGLAKSVINTARSGLGKYLSNNVGAGLKEMSADIGRRNAMQQIGKIGIAASATAPAIKMADAIMPKMALTKAPISLGSIEKEYQGLLDVGKKALDNDNFSLLEKIAEKSASLKALRDKAVTSSEPVLHPNEISKEIERLISKKKDTIQYHDENIQAIKQYIDEASQQDIPMMTKEDLNLAISRKNKEINHIQNKINNLNNQLNKLLETGRYGDFQQ